VFNSARGADKGAIERTLDLATALCLSLSPTRYLQQTLFLYQNKSPPAVQKRYGPVVVCFWHLQARIRFNTARDADKGAISPQTSPLPSGSLSYPLPTPGLIVPPKRVIVARTAALRLRLRPCLTSVVRMRSDPARGADTGPLQTSPLPSVSLSNPPPTHDPVSPTERGAAGRTVAPRLRMRPFPAPSSKNQVQPSSRCRQGGDVNLNLATAFWLSLLPATHSRLRCSSTWPVLGRTASLRPCLCLSLAPTSKNHV
jgi:hypothetical protein